MLKKLLPFEKVSQISKTDLAYVSGHEHLVPFFKYDLRFEVFEEIIKDKSQSEFPRELLVEVLREQYASIPGNEVALDMIDRLGRTNTFTVTTAHQPSLFLGPLYVVYKALTCINLAEAIQGIVGPKHNIVPIFVMGSEDHDIEEVNHIHLFHKKVTWNPPITGGPVGKISMDSIGEVLEQIKGILGVTENAVSLYERLVKACEQKTFAEATRALLHEFMGRYGLVVLDMNDARLKKQLIPVMEEELTSQISHQKVQNTVEQLTELGFKPQATPREINLFYLTDTSRDRIVKEGNFYKVLNNNILWSEAEILQHLRESPEKFSPNVVLRPLYQEIILPNLAYVGGGGEIAYWLERKPLFEHFGVNYPMLVRRNSLLWIDREMAKRMERLGFTAEQIFEDVDVLIKQYVAANASMDMNLDAELRDLKRIIKSVSGKSLSIDPTLEKSIEADGVRMLGIVENWQARLVKAEKQRHEITLNQLRAFKEKLFPGNGLQERYDNFLPFYLRYGDRYFDILKERMLPLEYGFVILEDS